MMKYLLILASIPLLSHSQQIDSSKTTLQNQQIYHLNGVERIYQKPKFFDFITNVPKNFINSNKSFVADDNPYYLTATALSTLAIIPFDQKLTDGARNFAENIGLSEDNNYYKLWGQVNIPQNIGAGLYLIGNGSTSMMLAIGFGTYGIIKNDYRAQATASGVMESLILSGVFSQTIKRISGRESPFIARMNGNPGGKWQVFPSFKNYQKHTPQYDAFPSGHLTTIMSATTVIADNYPEVKWIKPVGYSLIGLMSFQMVQSEVHWVSDYPIAVFMGYLIGKTISKSRYENQNSNTALHKKYKLDFTASRAGDYNLFGLKLHL